MEELRKKVEELILKAKNEEDIAKFQKLNLIKAMLQHDDCFFKITSDIALFMLKDLEIENPIEIYKKLISIKNFNKNFDKEI